MLRTLVNRPTPTLVFTNNDALPSSHHQPADTPRRSTFLASDHSFGNILATLINKESRQHLEATSCGPHIPPSACLPSKHTSRLTSSGCVLSYLCNYYITH